VLIFVFVLNLKKKNTCSKRIANGSVVGHRNQALGLPTSVPSAVAGFAGACLCCVQLYVRPLFKKKHLLEKNVFPLTPTLKHNNVFGLTK